jgi:hypothetical protein
MARDEGLALSRQERYLAARKPPDKPPVAPGPAFDFDEYTPWFDKVKRVRDALATPRRKMLVAPARTHRASPRKPSFYPQFENDLRVRMALAERGRKAGHPHVAAEAEIVANGGGPILAALLEIPVEKVELPARQYFAKQQRAATASPRGARPASGMLTGSPQHSAPPSVRRPPQLTTRAQGGARAPPPLPDSGSASAPAAATLAGRWDAALSQQHGAARARAFERVDRDRNGGLSREEILKSILALQLSTSPGEIDQLMAKCDTNGCALAPPPARQAAHARSVRAAAAWA